MKTVIIAAAFTAIAISGLGCASRTAAVALGTAVGVGVGVPAATRSHVEVEVQMFNEGKLTEKQKAVFVDKTSKLIRTLRQCRDAGLAQRDASTTGEETKGATKEAADAMKKFSETAIANAPAPKKDSLQMLQKDWMEAADAIEKFQITTSADLQPLLIKSQAFTFKADSFLKAANTVVGTSSTEEAKEKVGYLKALLASYNTGPIVDEVTQVVLSKGAMLDVVTDPDFDNKSHWRQIAFAESDGGAGDHNAVIYLENMATPVLKNSKFDPTAFIRAYAKTYEAAFGALAKAYGISLAPEAATQSSTYGPLTSQIRTDAARAKTSEDRKRLLDAADALVKLYNDSVKDKPKDKPLADADAIKTKLAEIALKLEN